jgi:hypothetical protein
MDPSFVVKLICDLSLWFCTAGFILSFFGASGSAFGAVGIMVLSCALCGALQEKKPALRLLPLILLAFCGFWLRSAADALLLIPPCFFCVWLCVRENFSPDYSECSGYFKKAAVALLLFALLTSIAGGAARLETYTLPYLISFLFCGVLMLRLLRHDEQKRREWRLWIVVLASLAVCCFLALLLSSEPLLSAAGKGLGALYGKVVSPVLLGFAYLIAFLGWFFWQVIHLNNFGGGMPFSKEPMREMNQDFSVSGAVGGEGSDMVVKIVMALVVIVFIALAFAIFRMLARANGRLRQSTGVKESRHRTADEKGSLSVRSILAPRSPREAVRWYYRKFLLRAKAGGLVIKPHDTSESIGRNAESLYDPGLLSELRKLYIVARYSSEAVTKENARQARSIYVKLKTTDRSEA